MKNERWKIVFAALLTGSALLSLSCALKSSGKAIPREVETLVNSFGDDLTAGRYEKIYQEAADEWRQDATLEQSNKVFETLKAKLGKPTERALHSASETNGTNGALSGHSFVLMYETRFERGNGMETFTIVERNGHWLLARYFVNSTALK
jgi:hypothetical protein